MRDLQNRTVLITGANTGIGRATAEALAARGATIIIATRSEEKTQPVLETIAAAGGSARFLPLDLGDLDSVRACAAALGKTPVHVLIANAGLAGTRGKTASGFELCFGVNHVGHYLLVRLLEGNLRSGTTADRPARVVLVSSRSHYQANGIDWEAIRRPTKSTTGLPEYSVSKLANVLFANEISRRWADMPIIATSLHPGVIASDIWRHVPAPVRWIMKRFMKSIEEGAATSIHCATADVVSGAYYSDSKEKKASGPALDTVLASELWHRSAQWTGLE